MPRTIRFHLDEHVSLAIAAGLRRLGIDVSTTTDAGLLGAPDTEHLTYSLTERRVIFTQDDDYLILHSHGIAHAGIAYCHQQLRSIGEIIRGLVLIWELLEPVEMMNRVEFL